MPCETGLVEERSLLFSTQKSRESTWPLVWPPVFDDHLRCRLPPGKSSSTSFTCFAFCLREWLSCRNMANFSFAILLLDYLTRRQGTFSLRRCLQTLDHLMQELLRVCAAFSRSCGYCCVFLVVQRDLVCHRNASSAE